MVRGITSSLTKFYYEGALSHSDAAQIVNLIEFPPKKKPYESLKERFTVLHTLNLFQK